MDPYTRARTVRIGKWRWPPPKEEMDAAAGNEGGADVGEGFFEFKMRKMQERKLSQERAQQMQQQQPMLQAEGGAAALADEQNRRSKSREARERGT